MQTVSVLLVQPWISPSFSAITPRTLVPCAIWQHTCLPRGSCQILRLQHPLSSETQEFCTAIFDTFSNGTQAEAVDIILASRNSCRNSHATHRICVVRTVHLFQIFHPTRTDCSLAFCSLCSSVVVMLERLSGTSGTRPVFETELATVVCSPFFRARGGGTGVALSSAPRNQCVLLPIILECPPTIARSLF